MVALDTATMHTLNFDIMTQELIKSMLNEGRVDELVSILAGGRVITDTRYYGRKPFTWLLAIRFGKLSFNLGAQDPYNKRVLKPCEIEAAIRQSITYNLYSIEVYE